MLRKLSLLLLLCALVACETPVKNMNIEPAVMVKKISPVYPPQAKADSVEGWVWVRYTVTDKGVVVNPEVTKSDPQGVFDDSALLAIYQFEYTPRIVDGKPTSITGMTYRFDFNLE
jgi:protein TonB